jgi:hypothetical protein
MMMYIDVGETEINPSNDFESKSGCGLIPIG